jgi:DNA-binding response OmpR family regulator
MWAPKDVIVRILIIEDDADIASNVYDYLEARGNTVDHTADGVTGLHMAVTREYDAIVLDVALPGMSGFDVCRKLREDARRDTPVLMLTARDTLEDKLSGFERGADDYVIKPFALREIEARLRALTVRHQGRVGQRLLKTGDLTFDPSTLSITRSGHAVKLPPKCVRLLEVMMQRPGHVFSRTELESAVWGESLESSETLRTHMHLLRKALALADRPDPIETVQGFGYRLRESAQ